MSCNASVPLSVLTPPASAASVFGSAISRPPGIAKSSAIQSSLVPSIDAIINKPKEKPEAIPPPITTYRLIMPRFDRLLNNCHMDTAMGAKNAKPPTHSSTLTTMRGILPRETAVILNATRRQMKQSACDHLLLKYGVSRNFIFLNRTCAPNGGRRQGEKQGLAKTYREPLDRLGWPAVSAPDE
jgi:hypothetical protein